MSSWRASGSSGEGVRGPVGTLESRLLFLTRQKPVAGLTPSGILQEGKQESITRGLWETLDLQILIFAWIISKKSEPSLGIDLRTVGRSIDEP
ncbi:uncharacterized protein isoform X1 [Castor canadensis]|uniref:Uncharacterized protein isoform X1 n=1 Tax=Castor canadensis TaxID=51338 RepID=A0AC58K247_CASCN